MTNDSTARLNLPYLVEGQAMKHLTINEALAALDGLVCAAVTSRTTAAQPEAPAIGSAYVLPAGRTGPEWGLHPPGSLLRFDEAGWTVLASPVGATAWDLETAGLIVRTEAGWEPLSATLRTLGNLQGVGVGTPADEDLPFSARLNTALFAARPTEEGGDGDLRLTLNKSTAADVLSLLFQTGFSARAEIGLVGDDRLKVRTSADGAVFQDALTVEPDGTVGLGRDRLRVGGRDLVFPGYNAAGVGVDDLPSGLSGLDADLAGGGLKGWHVLTSLRPEGAYGVQLALCDTSGGPGAVLFRARIAGAWGEWRTLL